MAYREILYEKEGNVAVITINRPQAMNAYTNLTIQEMAEVLEDASRDTGVRALILTGAGDRGFSTGADFSHLQRVAAGEESIVTPRLGGAEVSAHTFLQRLYYLEKPTFAAINGAVAVGSTGFIMACDIRIASDKARIAPMFLSRSLLPHNGVSWWLPRLLGEGRALELLYNRSDILNAEEALKLGLVSHVVPHAQLMAFTKDYATRIGNGPPLALAMTKRVIRRAFDNTLPVQMELESYSQNICHQSEDFKEATAAFKEKREPVFRGR